VNPTIPPIGLWSASIAFGLVVAGILGGSRIRFFSTLAGGTAFAGSVLYYASTTKWFLDPSLGIFGVGFLALVSAAIVIQLITGLDSKKGLVAGFGSALATAGLYLPLQTLMSENASIFSVLLVYSITVGVGILIGSLVSKIDRRVYMRVGLFTALLATGPIVIDRFLQEFSGYMMSDAVAGRPVPTLGQANDLLTPEQMGNFWISGLDTAMHLLLPTIALTLISFAGYVRFSRGSLLEVLNMDYIRTARAKGLTERTVIVRHGMRNAMLPLTTILVNDFAGLIGGAIITEGIFAWKGMGQLFNEAIRSYDLNLFMGVFIITASLTVLANFVADLLYGVVDPRIRIRK
jgi:peptide/nickel transport system permease protein